MEKEESSFVDGAKEAEEEQNASNYLTSNQYALGSRASSPSSHYREPLVQIMNDSEFSSPGRGASSMQDLEKQEAKEHEENAAM